MIDRKLLDACVHCGLCLTACPTYEATGNELHSPRGRIQLVKSLATGRAADADVVKEHLDLCLGCRACEPACPSGVKYGFILEQGREELAKKTEPNAAEKTALDLVHGLSSSSGALRSMRLLWLARRTGMMSFVERRGPNGKVIARVAPDPRWRPWSRTVPPMQAATGSRRGAVAMLPGCVMDQAFASVHQATSDLLRRAGFDVYVPRGPICCGALAAHVGDAATAKSALAEFTAGLKPFPVDAVIVNSAGCGSHLKEADWPLARTTFDLTEWLDKRGLSFTPGPVAHQFGRPKGQRLRVAYQDACHLRHGQRIVDAPRSLLAKLPDVDVVPLADPGGCCGSAGVYNITQPEMADLQLAKKLGAIRAADPHLVVTANPGCHLQIASGLRERGDQTPVEHIATLLAASIPAR